MDWQFDTVIAGGVAAAGGELTRMEVGITGGRITALMAPGTACRAKKTIDAQGRFVLPGAIDTHTHVEWPLGKGAQSLDTFESATAAAAIAGTTTILDFVPPPEDESHLAAARRRLAQAAGRCAIDYSFRPMLVSADHQALLDIAQLAELGMRSFKIFTAGKGMRLTDGEIYRAMGAIGGADGLAVFHAENDELVSDGIAVTLASSGSGIRQFPQSRPEIAEEAAIDLVSLYARSHDLPIYIVHVTGSAGLRAIRRARDLGTKVRGETCTHYLVFDDRVFRSDDRWMYVITPPIRKKSDQSDLWDALQSGLLTCVGSDHCAYGRDHKHPEQDDFTNMAAGAPGLDARVPMLLSRGVNDQRLSLERFVKVAAQGPAETFGLFPQKGTIQVGSDADIIVVDLDSDWVWPHEPSGWGSDFQPFGGISGRGRVETTLLRGQTIAENGVFVGGLNGRFLYQQPIRFS